MLVIMTGTLGEVAGYLYILYGYQLTSLDGMDPSRQ